LALQRRAAITVATATGTAFNIQSKFGRFFTFNLFELFISTEDSRNPKQVRCRAQRFNLPANQFESRATRLGWVTGSRSGSSRD
jgi:hypothetical protein